ncbi:MAG TPA: glycoside hydrolase family 3 protein [Pyrinomonadaceae bacterium]|nr:glycoside hydrolase family 3 protein [Pyrinomonadaceae bacterium]
MNRRKFISSTLAATGGLLVSRSEGNAQRLSPKPFTAYDRQVRALLSRMTLQEKIGQMLQAEQDKLAEGDIEKYSIGSVLSGGSSDPKSGNSLEAWTNLYDSLQSQALKTRLRIPILYGIDAVHGHNNVLNAVVFPHNIALGCTRNPSLVERAARITAIDVKATGINWTFAPCVTVPRDERWGRTYEGFGETPELARDLGAAAVRGFQGNDLSDPLSVLACAKHFIGDGGTSFGTGPKNQLLDRGDTKISEQELRSIHMAGYVSAIRAGVGTIMPSYSSWNGVKCSGNKRLLTEILKNELKFEGFLISDYDAIDEMPGDFKTQIETSVNAGMDMFMVPKKFPQLYTLLLELVNEKRVAMSRIDDAVKRILRVKFATGLLDKDRSPLADRKLHSSFGSAEHRQVARECVRETLVLLKNDKRTLPLSKSLRQIVVAGSSADDIGKQCGGWTISWQGKSGNITGGGTTILAALKQSVSSNTEVVYSPDGSNVSKADAAIVVVGEVPYAEFMGDRASLNLPDEDLAAIERVKRAGIPTIVLMFSGRPIIINRALELSDAFVAAWLPGTEGRGVTDVLFGDFPFKGKLSFSWPQSMEQIPINVGDSNYQPLFKYGFGLQY